MSKQAINEAGSGRKMSQRVSGRTMSHQVVGKRCRDKNAQPGTRQNGLETKSHRKIDKKEVEMKNEPPGDWERDWGRK